MSEALLALLFLGMIPGTTIMLPPVIIILVSVVGTYLLVRWIANQPLFIGNQAGQEKLARQLARKKIRAMSEANAAKRAAEKPVVAVTPATRRRHPAKI